MRKVMRLNMSSSTLLNMVCLENNINITELSREIDITYGHVHTIVDFLVSKGIVTKKIPKENKRIRLLSLTDKGKEFVSALKKVREIVK